jgi:hypothetical protein
MSAPLSCNDAIEALLSTTEISNSLTNLETKHSELAQLVSRVVEDLVSQVQTDAQFDLQPLIDAFLCNERDQTHERKQFQAAIASLWRVVPRRSTRLLILNARRLFDLFDRASEIYREARWRLMYARAYYTPSRGVGEICGSNGEP